MKPTEWEFECPQCGKRNPGEDLASNCGLCGYDVLNSAESVKVWAVLDAEAYDWAYVCSDPDNIKPSQGILRGYQ